MRRFGLQASCLISGVLFWVPCGFGGVMVTNPSFEDTTGVSFIDCGGGCQYSQGLIPGWTINFNPGTVSGLFRPLSGDFNFVPDGITIAYSNGGTISQNVGTVEEGSVYTLKVDLGDRVGFPFTSSAELLAGSTVVATATGTAPTDGNWSDFTASFTGTAAEAGELITIRLLSTGEQGAFDDVQLAAVPEPAFFAVVGFGLAGLLVFVRRHRSA